MSRYDSKADLKVHEITTLGKSRDAEAKDMLRKVAHQVQPIMRRRGWTVPLLAEFYPPAANLLGLNIGGGGGRTLEIRVRLRPARDPDSFLPYDNVLGTMLHELVHNVRGPHDGAFYKLLDEITAECEELMAAGVGGTGVGFDGPSCGRLGSHGWIATHNPEPHRLRDVALQAAEERAKRQRIMGPPGGRKLGGGGGGDGPGGGGTAGYATPAAAAAAAAERRCRDNVWCPCERLRGAVERAMAGSPRPGAPGPNASQRPSRGNGSTNEPGASAAAGAAAGGSGPRDALAGRGEGRDGPEAGGGRPPLSQVEVEQRLVDQVERGVIDLTLDSDDDEDDSREGAGVGVGVAAVGAHGQGQGEGRMGGEEAEEVAGRVKVEDGVERTGVMGGGWGGTPAGSGAGGGGGAGGALVGSGVARAVDTGGLGRGAVTAWEPGGQERRGRGARDAGRPLQEEQQQRQHNLGQQQQQLAVGFQAPPAAVLQPRNAVTAAAAAAALARLQRQQVVAKPQPGSRPMGKGPVQQRPSQVKHGHSMDEGTGRPRGPSKAPPLPPPPQPQQHVHEAAAGPQGGGRGAAVAAVQRGRTASAPPTEAPPRAGGPARPVQREAGPPTGTGAGAIPLPGAPGSGPERVRRAVGDAALPHAGAGVGAAPGPVAGAAGAGAGAVLGRDQGVGGGGAPRVGGAAGVLDVDEDGVIDLTDD